MNHFLSIEELDASSMAALVDSAVTLKAGRGMRIAQLVIAALRRAAWQEVEDLDESARGDGGFGSTGLAADGNQVG